ncbi:hypothetical protein [Streptomyces canus]|uniref:hypothetical protein n=1 Tax=Streptomyces canus TaxID=58343 RepID=UPI00381CC539
MDEMLDFTRICWPNVDEDDCRESADAMREFAEQFEGHGAEAPAAGGAASGPQARLHSRAAGT